MLPSFLLLSVIWPSLFLLLNTIVIIPKYIKIDMRSSENWKEASIFDKSEYADLFVKKPEDFTRIVLDRLKNILSPRALVSSQTYRWLRSENIDRTPDAFIIHSRFIHRNAGSTDDLFGAPAHESLYKGMGILNIKPEKAAWNGMVSEIMEQLSLVRERARKYGNYNFVNGALVTRVGICLVQMTLFVDPCIKLIAWDAKGGAAELSEYFKELPVARILDPLLDVMDLHLSDPAECLGCGRLGTVFKVRARDADGPWMALKVVAGEDRVQSLRSEFLVNRDAFRVAPDQIVRALRFDTVRLTGMKDNELAGAGMLMEEVGEKVVDTGPESLKKALSALSALHRAGYRHGSARLDNLLSCGGAGGGYKWCDLQRASLHGCNQALQARIKESMARKGAEDESEEKMLGSMYGIDKDVSSLIRSFGQTTYDGHLDLQMKYVASDFSLDSLVCLAAGICKPAQASGGSARQGGQGIKDVQEGATSVLALASPKMAKEIKARPQRKISVPSGLQRAVEQERQAQLTEPESCLRSGKHWRSSGHP